MRITCTLGTIREAIAEIEDYEKSLGKKLHVLMAKLAEIGIESATVGFDHAVYDGDNDVSVDQTPKWVGNNKLVISASGSAITFIEFGAGVFNPGVHPKAASMGMVRGAYGKGQGKHKSWVYIGDPSGAKAGGKAIKKGNKTVILTSGNNPNRCMYTAGKAMREDIVKIAREVFKSD